MSKILLSGVAATILAASAGPAAAVTLGDITIFDYGRVSATAPDSAQPGIGTNTAQIQIGQVNGPGNPTQFDNPGWNPFGLSDTIHHWWNIEGGEVTMNGSGNALIIVWGSPNDNNPAATNTVSFYTGVGGTGTLIGQVLASDLYANFPGTNNTQDPGYLISFLSDQTFGSIVFTTGSSAFEFAVAGVAEPSTWAMLGIGFAGLALAGHKRTRNRLAPALG